MAELTLNQIEQKLNEEFSGGGRKLIFWYDENREFTDEIESLNLQNAKIYALEEDNQFYTKYFLEREDTDTSYLIYAPFAKPAVRDNHLQDMLRYSKEFFADKASMITNDLEIDERLKPVIQHYKKFFASQARMKKFYELEIEHFNKEIIETALISVLVNAKSPSIEEIVRSIIFAKDRQAELEKLGKYDLIEPFWNLCSIQFGFRDDNPSVDKLLYSLFITYIAKTAGDDLPKAWASFLAGKPGSIISFIDGIMNSAIYGSEFNEVSRSVAKAMDARENLKHIGIENVLECEVFRAADSIIINWIIDCLNNQRYQDKLSELLIPEICRKRRHMHFGSHLQNEYFVLENAYHVMSRQKYNRTDEIEVIAKKYTNEDCHVDRWYRCFYYYYDKLENKKPFENIRDLVENIYTNDFLNPVCVAWNERFASKQGKSGLPMQTSFVNRYLKHAKEKTVVIISDGLRYETGLSLYDKFNEDEKCQTEIEAMQTVLPSITPYGMASLLPYNKLEIDDSYNITNDELPSADIKQRATILQKHIEKSNCIQFDKLVTMKQAEMRQVFTGKDVVYVYHNQIDARGDKSATENEVFNACEEAIDEIYRLVKTISGSANTYRFIITADHGFIYKRDKIEEGAKISSDFEKGSMIGKRYCVSYSSESAVDGMGIGHVAIGDVFDYGDSRAVSFPKGSDIFKTAGSGMNYVHGGSSPQEMIIPVIDVKVEKRKVETKVAGISLVSLVSKITNLNYKLDFIQSEPIGNEVKETKYRLYFVDEDDNVISNENIYVADRKDEEVGKRLFSLSFAFKNQSYDREKKYYLIARDANTQLETLRCEVMMDLAFTDDFGFNI